MPGKWSRWAAIRRRLSGGAVLVLLSMVAGGAEAPEPVPAGPGLTDDPVLTALVASAMTSRPELAQAQAQADAARQRAPQAGALPDPVVSLGIQNDGFRSIQIGKMESSYLTAMASQTFPWRGKRGLRSEVLALGGGRAEADLERTRLSVRAEVEREYVDLLLVRDQRGLLARLEALWTQAEGLARIRYEAGNGAQSDLLRAQLERSRLRQQRAALAAEEQRRLAVLGRLSGLALADTVAAGRSLADVPDPALPDAAQAADDAEARSPELRRARLAAEASVRLVALARLEYRPDLTANLGLMPRWGEFSPMWQAGVSFSVPVWAGRRQSRGLEEARLQGVAAERSVDAVRRLVRQRAEERLAVLGGLVEANRLYRAGLLVQSEATVASTVVQYQVGKVSFASVLEAITGYVGDTNGYRESVAATQRLDIAQREASLEPVSSLAWGGAGGTAMPGAGAMGGVGPGGAGRTSPAPAAGPAPVGMPRM